MECAVCFGSQRWNNIYAVAFTFVRLVFQKLICFLSVKKKLNQ